MKGEWLGLMLRGVYNFLSAPHERQNAPDYSGEDFTQAVAKERMFINEDCLKRKNSWVSQNKGVNE